MYEGIEGAIILSAIALIMVFIILGLLALLMIGLRKIVEISSLKLAKDKKPMTEEHKDLEKDKIMLMAQEKEKQSTKQSEREATVAVITAAVASYLKVSKPLDSIRVISIKRIVPQTIHPWAIAGRHYIMNQRISISRKEGGW